MVELKGIVKQDCSSCKGTGIHKISKDISIGTVCTFCKGKGYKELHIINNEMKYLLNDETKEINILCDKELVQTIPMFIKIKKCDDIKYVVYDGIRDLASIDFEQAIRNKQIVTLEQFYNGQIPLPIESKLCPKQFERLYADENIIKDCNEECNLVKCPKYGSKECWENYYGADVTIEEKQAILKKRLR